MKLTLYQLLSCLMCTVYFYKNVLNKEKCLLLIPLFQNKSITFFQKSVLDSSEARSAVLSENSKRKLHNEKVYPSSVHLKQHGYHVSHKLITLYTQILRSIPQEALKPCKTLSTHVRHDSV